MIEEAVERLDAIGLRWIEDACRAKLSDVPDVLYHYTDATGLAGMLSSGTLWLTDSRFLNDKTEGLHFTNIVRDLMLKRLAANDDEVALRLYAEVQGMLPPTSKYDTFIFSVSDKADDLSQWRGYAREGMGFNIGFDAPALFNGATSDPGTYNFTKIEYRHATQERLARRIIGEIEAQLVKEVADTPALRDDLVKEAARTFIWVTDNHSAFSKHKSFAAEGEWRISTYSSSESGETQVRSSGLNLVPYITLEPCGPGRKLPVKSIKIGPGFADAQIKDAVQALCRRFGYGSVQVDFAETPYRRP